MAVDVILENAEIPVQITLGGSAVSYKPGDLIGYSSGWVKALATVSSIVNAELIVGQKGVSGDVITCFRRAVLWDRDAPYTAGSKYWLGETGNGELGGITATKPSTTGDREQCVGIAVSTERVIVDLHDPAGANDIA
jgi:hypothetical protein